MKTLNQLLDYFLEEIPFKEIEEDEKLKKLYLKLRDLKEENGGRHKVENNEEIIRIIDKKVLSLRPS